MRGNSGDLLLSNIINFNFIIIFLKYYQFYIYIYIARYFLHD